MLDSLDLAELRRIAQEDKKAEQRRSVISWGMIIVCFGLGGFVPALLPITPETPFIVSFAPLGFFVLIALIGVFWLYRPNMRLHQRITQYAPPFVARAKPSFDWKSMLYSSALFIAVVGMALSIVSPLIVIVVGFAPMVYQLLLAGIYQNWVRRGKHHQRLQRIDLLIRLLPFTSLPRQLKATLLHQAGQVEAATQIYRNLLQDPHYTGNPFMTSVYLNDLAYMLILDKQFEGTREMLEAAIRISPHIGSFYDSLAAYYLEQSIYPERALELTQTAIEYTDKRLVESHAIQKATSARALALTGYHSNANALLDEAFAVMKRLSFPVQAEVYRQAGYTRHIQGDEAGAREYFSKAIQLDPDGLYGRLAQRALDSSA